MTALYRIQDVSLPVSFQLIAETEYYINPKDGKEKRRCPVPKNQYCREMTKQAVISQIRFGYVLTDVRSASAENMMFIRHDINKDSVMPVRTNRNIALSYDDKLRGKYVRADMADLRTDIPEEIFPENVDFPMLPVKQVFTDRDGSTGVLYPVSSHTGMTYEQITETCRRRWSVECYHKSLKQNASLEKSPAKIINTQKNHFSASLCGCVRLGMLRFSGKLNHFALRAEIYISALRVAFSELQKLQPLKITA
jgi:hypothetical protein